MFNNKEYNSQIQLFIEEFKTNQGLKRNDFLDISDILLSGGFNIEEFFQQNNYTQNIYGEILKENIEIDLSKINKNKIILHSPNHFAALYKKDDKFYLMDSLSGCVNWKFKNGEVYEVDVPQQDKYTNDCAIYTMVNLEYAEKIIENNKNHAKLYSANNTIKETLQQSKSFDSKNIAFLEDLEESEYIPYSSTKISKLLTTNTSNFSQISSNDNEKDSKYGDSIIEPSEELSTSSISFKHNNSLEENFKKPATYKEESLKNAVNKISKDKTTFKIISDFNKYKKNNEINKDLNTTNNINKKYPNDYIKQIIDKKLNKDLHNGMFHRDNCTKTYFLQTIVEKKEKNPIDIIIDKYKKELQKKEQKQHQKNSYTFSL